MSYLRQNSPKPPQILQKIRLRRSKIRNKVPRDVINEFENTKIRPPPHQIQGRKFNNFTSFQEKPQVGSDEQTN